MPNCREFQFGLVCLIMAAFTGLAGFAIVYHYATSERPIEQFAIVVDAGSTQTRSSLFMLNVDIERMLDWTSEIDEDSIAANNAADGYELSKMIEVKQVSSCVNGGPLAAIQSENEARKLINSCLKKFARQIKRLDFINSEGLSEQEAAALDEEQAPVNSLDTDEVADRLALLNHRVNSLTHLHLGATAGMRALNMINETKSKEKLAWIDKAISESNQQLAFGPYINKGFVDIIAGADEAAFGWTSVNFVCNRLDARHKYSDCAQVNGNQTTESKQNGEHNGDYLGKSVKGCPSNSLAYLESIGTVELGGASSQISYQMPSWFPDDKITSKLSMEPKNLKLFNVNYKLATRSDLCLGMSQATLRVKYVLLRDHYDSLTDETKSSQQQQKLIQIINPCFQNQSKTNLSSADVSDILKAPCLVSSSLDKISDQFKASINGSQETIYQFLGTGDIEQCNPLVTKLLDSATCNKYFSLCPSSRRIEIDPSTSKLPFVTISGYNKALQVLNLSKRQLTYSDEPESKKRSQLDELIGEKLGGYSIDYQEFLGETRKFCSLDIDSFPSQFPSLHKAYYRINCLQLIYINKLLTEFYSFDPLTSWDQLRFLLFPVAPKASTKHDDKNDIGWSLGLLLNTVSQQFAGEDDSLFKNILYHNGSSIIFIMRTTVFLMLACLLLAISLIVTAVFAAKNRGRKRDSYIDHSHDQIVPNV